MEAWRGLGLECNRPLRNRRCARFQDAQRLRRAGWTNSSTSLPAGDTDPRAAPVCPRRCFRGLPRYVTRRDQTRAAEYRLVGQHQRARQQIEHGVIGAGHRSVELPSRKHSHAAGAHRLLDDFLVAGDALSGKAGVNRAQKFFADRSFGERKQQSFIYGIGRSLGGGIELSYGFDFVPEELDTHRAFVFGRIHIEDPAAQSIFAGHFDDIGGVVADRVEMRKQRVNFQHFAAAHRSRQIGVILSRTQTKGGGGNRVRPRTMLHRWQSSTARLRALPGSRDAVKDSGRAGHRGWEGKTTESGSAAPVSSQKACSTGTRSSAARLSGTTIIRGRPTAFCRRTRSKALAVGTSPETRIRSARSLRWEATREKAGNFSTSAKRSRTKGRTIAI